MADKSVESGFPVDGGVDEKLAYLTKQISPDELKSDALSGNGEPVWVLCGDGSLRFANAVIETKGAK